MRVAFCAVLFDLFGTLVDESALPVRGAHALLEELAGARWGIVTSLGGRSAPAVIRESRFPQPPVLVTASDVERGKPAPDGYLLAARRLGVDPSGALVVEDTAMGIAAGRAAGMSVAAVLCGRAPDFARRATFVLPDLAALRLTRQGDGAALDIEA